MVYALVIHTLYCEPLEMPHLFYNILSTYAFHANKNGSKSFFHFSGDSILGFNDL